MTNEERPNRVQAHADCPVAGTLKEPVDVFEHDMACFNELPEEERGSHVRYWFGAGEYRVPMVGPVLPTAFPCMMTLCPYGFGHSAGFPQQSLHV